MEDKKIVSGWEKAETGSGVLYYVNHANKNTQWDHPKYRAALEMLEECDNIKYAAYRAATKLSIMQRTLGLEHVRLAIFSGVFQRHHIQATENSLALECSELEVIISDMFFAASKETGGHLLPIEICTELTLNFLLNIYDRHDRKKVNVLGAKVALVCLCTSRLQEKYQYLFSQVADHNNCLSRRKLQALLQCLVQITDYFSESLAFSADLIHPTIESCFQQSHGPLGISEDVFMSWIMREPQLLVWLSTFYRLRAAEKVSHGVRCGVCRTYPIVGLRYRCLRCLAYDQCQSCFFHGRLSKRHKLKHPMQEYCWETTTGEATVAFLKGLVNRLCGNTSRLQYLPVQPNSNQNRLGTVDNSDEVTMDSSVDSSSIASSVDSMSTPHLRPQQELQSIILQLERQLETLCQDESSVNVKLQQHRLFLEAQVHRLKQLKNQLHFGNRQIERMQSTPVSPSFARGNVAEFQELSPIFGNVEPSVTCDLSGVSTWIGGKADFENQCESGFSQWLNKDEASSCNTGKCLVDAGSEDGLADLDTIMDKLQNILASKFSLSDHSNKNGYSPLKVESC